MPVLDPADALNDLIAASAHAREAAASAIARSEALRSYVTEAHRRSLAARLSSRAQKAFVRLHGVVNGLEVVAVVRADGSVAGSSNLLHRARLLVAMGERFEPDDIEASLNADPVATVLTLIRACDWVSALELVTSAPRDPGPSALS